MSTASEQHDGWIAAWDGQYGIITEPTGKYRRFSETDWLDDDEPKVGMRVRYGLHVDVATYIEPTDTRTVSSKFRRGSTTNQDPGRDSEIGNPSSEGTHRSGGTRSNPSGGAQDSTYPIRGARWAAHGSSGESRTGKSDTPDRSGRGTILDDSNAEVLGGFKGVVSDWDGHAGKIDVDGGSRYGFDELDWRTQEKEPGVGDRVTFNARGNRAEMVRLDTSNLGCWISVFVVIGIAGVLGFLGFLIGPEPRSAEDLLTSTAEAREDRLTSTAEARYDRLPESSKRATETALENLDTPNDECAHWWDRSHTGLGRAIEDYLVDPDHQSTLFGGFDVHGTQYIFARYRTESLFGTYVDWQVTAEGTVDCDVIGIEIE